MNPTPFTPAGFAFLRKNIDKMSYEALSEHFKVPVWTIRKMCKQQHIVKKGRVMKPKKFSPAADKFLRENIYTLTCAEIGAQVGASASGVSKRIRELGLKKKVPSRIRKEIGQKRQQKKELRPSQVIWLHENAANYTIADLAERMGMNPQTLRARMIELGIERPRRVQTVKRAAPTVRRKPAAPPRREGEVRFEYDAALGTSREQQLRDFMRKVGAKPLPRRQLFQPATIARV